MIITIGSQKGTVGKSAFACSLAVYFNSRSYRTLLVDTDISQYTTSNWHKERELAQHNPSIELKKITSEIRKEILKIESDYDYIIIDTGGRESRELREGLSVADIAVFLFKPEKVFLDTFDRLDDLTGQAGGINKKLKAFSLFTIVQKNYITRERFLTKFTPTLEAGKHIAHLPTHLIERTAYPYCDELGLGITESKDSKAKREFLAVIKAMNLEEQEVTA
jgi:chromosome partitioning protein